MRLQSKILYKFCLKYHFEKTDLPYPETAKTILDIELIKPCTIISSSGIFLVVVAVLVVVCICLSREIMVAPYLVKLHSSVSEIGVSSSGRRSVWLWSLCADQTSCNPYLAARARAKETHGITLPEVCQCWQPKILERPLGNFCLYFIPKIFLCLHLAARRFKISFFFFPPKQIEPQCMDNFITNVGKVIRKAG